jgi:aerobic-type carbon monoxide dehydrogenase small subunit (CoxS/CutS family)
MAKEKEREPREEKGAPSQISRREFLRDAGLVVGGATIGSMAFLDACKSSVTATVTSTTTKTNTTTVTSPGGTATVTVTAPPVTVTQSTAAPVVNLTVNGQNYQVQPDPKWSLQYVLHEMLGFISVKEMCTKHGACGSCTVIMNGRPIVSCMALAIECDDAVIQTAEGIADSNHPIVEAYVMGNCMQCGYCTPGFVVTAKALLDKNTNPTQDDILTALSGNICRCATYPFHIPAIQATAKTLRGG